MSKRMIQRLAFLVVLITGLFITGTVMQWRAAVAQPFTPNVELIATSNTDAVYIDVPPFLPRGDYVIEVYSTIQAKDWIDAQTGEPTHLGQGYVPKAGIQDLQLPTVVYRQGFSEWTTVSIPPILSKGAYTVIMHLAYDLNPIKRIEQSGLIAVVIVR